MFDPIKPCEIPCPKCGHAEVRRVFRARYSKFNCEKYGVTGNNYACALAHVAEVNRDHIDNYCHCCQYRWQTLPMRKPKKYPTPQACKEGG